MWFNHTATILALTLLTVDRFHSGLDLPGFLAGLMTASVALGYINAATARED